MDVVLCSHAEYMYMKEYIQTFLQNRQLILYTNRIPIVPLARLWFVRRIPTGFVHSNTINFINTEQLSVPSKLAEYYTYIRPGVNVYDYSLENIKISGQGTYLPYSEIPEETAKLKIYLQQEKEYDFAVIGSPSAYRTALIDSIQEKGYSVYHVHGWDDIRDNEVGKCKSLLNLHYNSEYTIYESIRCERWRFAGMPIYSEACLGGLPDGVLDISTLVSK